MDSIPLNERNKSTSAIRQSRTFDSNSQNSHPRIKKDDFIRNHPFWYARLDSNQRPLESESNALSN